MLLASPDFSIDPFLQYGSFGLLAFIVFWAIWKFLPAMTERHFTALDQLATKNEAALKGIAESHKDAVDTVVATYEKEAEECRSERIQVAKEAAAERAKDQEARHEMIEKFTLSNADLQHSNVELQKSHVAAQGSIVELQRMVTELHKTMIEIQRKSEK